MQCTVRTGLMLRGGDMTLYVATITVLSDDFQRMSTSYNKNGMLYMSSKDGNIHCAHLLIAHSIQCGNFGRQHTPCVEEQCHLVVVVLSCLDQVQFSLCIHCNVKHCQTRMLPKMEFQLEVAVGWLAGQVMLRQKMDLQLEQEVEVGQMQCIVQGFD